ncbi:MAG: hypothetical protein HQM13_16470 [SAR324 cluster bacterium]|nr:hypothetical protein [SAR324 cluster bacterium]
MKQFYYNHLFFKMLEWVVIGVCLVAILFHLFGLSQTMLFNEDIWLWGKFDLNNFWFTVDPIHYAPLTNLLFALSYEFLPLWGPWSHLQMMILYLIFIALCFRFFHKILQLPSWITWLGIGLLTSFPFLTEGTFWIFGAHSFHSVIWFLATLNLLPEKDRQNLWRYWIAPGTTLLIMLSSSPVTYPSYFLLLFYFAVRFHKNRHLLFFWGVLFLIGLFYIYLRNLLNYQDGWAFLSPTESHYAIAAQSFPVHYLQSMVEILEYSNPVIVLQRYIFQGFLSQSPLDLASLLHLLWVLPAWGIILVRDFSKAREIFLYGAGAAGVILVTASPHPTRYMIPLIFVQTTGILLLLQHLIHPLQIFRKTIFLMLGLCLMGSNLSIKMKAEWFQWLIPKQIEQSVLDIAVQAKEQDPPLIFINHKIWKKIRFADYHYTGGDSASFGELRKVLEYAKFPRCIYQGYLQDADSEEIEMVHNENDSVFENSHRTRYTCPAVLKPLQSAHCFEYDNSRELFGGEFKRISGFATVPGSLGVDPENWRKHEKTFDIKVQCI